MRNLILENIKDGLTDDLGEKSSYDTLQVEDIQARLPDSILVNYFIGLSIDRASVINQEIGKFHPSNNEYLCSVVVRVRNGDYQLGQTELDTFVRRITKYFAKDTGSLLGLNSNEDGVDETVISYNIEDFDFIAGQAKKKVGLIHLCMINLRIKTNLNI